MAQRARLGGGIRLARPHPSGLVAMAAAVALSAWLITGHQSHSASVGGNLPPTAIESTGGFRIAPVALDATELETRAAALGEPLYWAGPEPGPRYELSRDESRDVFVRYLPAGVAAGDTRGMLTIATIPLANAYEQTVALAGQAGVVSKRLPDGGLAVYRRERPVPVYVAHPDVDYLAQISDPAPARARELAFSGRIRQVG